MLIDERGLILVRKPSDRSRGHAWTFAQGGPLAGEAPYDTAIRETLEETGYLGRPLLALPGQFAGRRRVARFFLARPVEHRPEEQDGETEEVRWVAFAEACRLVSLSNRKRRERDLRILQAVAAVVPGLEG
jgi:8-oxo-dGTP pyrophosphatase MutT (NUDIX family)